MLQAEIERDPASARYYLSPPGYYLDFHWGRFLSPGLMLWGRSPCWARTERSMWALAEREDSLPRCPWTGPYVPGNTAPVSSSGIAEQDLVCGLLHVLGLEGYRKCPGINVILSTTPSVSHDGRCLNSTHSKSLFPFHLVSES